MTKLIVAHGSKVAQTNDIMLQYMDALRKRDPDSRYEMCYLQLMSPSLQEVTESIYRRGERDLLVFPFFLFDGNHIREDIPEELERLRSLFPDLRIRFLAPIGFDEKIVDVILERTGYV